MSREFYYLEHQIEDLIYPAKLTAPVKRLLAAKMVTVREEYNNTRYQLQVDRNSVSNRRQTELKKLPPAARPLAKKYQKAAQQLAAIQDKLKAAGIEPAYGSTGYFLVQATEAEVKAKVAEFDAKLAALEADFAKTNDDLAKIAKGLAAAEIAKLKERLAKNSPQLVADLDNIGQPVLPEPAKPQKALTGKTQKAAEAADEAVHTASRD